MFSTLGGDPTMVAALRSMLKHVSEIIDDGFEVWRDPECYEVETPTGIEFKVSPTLGVE